MDDLLGYRRLLGLITPASNTVAIADACRISLTGVTAHQSDFHHDDDGGGDDALVGHIRDAVLRMDCKKPIETGLLVDEDLVGNDDIALGGLSEVLGRPELISPHTAILAAVARFGQDRRIAVVSPFAAERHARAVERLKVLGLLVVSEATLDLANSRAVARTRYDIMRQLCERAMHGGGDLVLQLGHNLPMARQVDNLEEDFAMPVLAINTICIWYMLRQSGIFDPIPGHGVLLLDH